jgi:hypothetical protein
MKPDTFISEARARIIWGESSSSVRNFLTTNGVSDIDADAKIKGFIAERNAEIRRIGLALIVGATVIIFLCLKQTTVAMFYSTGKGVALSFLGGLYGIWKLVKGIFWLVRPQSEEESITEISE